MIKALQLRLQSYLESGGDLLSRTVTSQVPSALKGLTSVFGMGTGGTPSSLPPEMVSYFCDFRSFPWVCSSVTFVPFAERSACSVVLFFLLTCPLGFRINRRAPQPQWSQLPTRELAPFRLTSPFTVFPPQAAVKGSPLTTAQLLIQVLPLPICLKITRKIKPSTY